MKSQALQELVKKIFGDEKTRSQFESDPESVLARFSLTDEEKRAVLSINAKLGLVGAGSSQLEAAIEPTATWHAPTP